MPTYYRLAPAVVLRLTGLTLVVMAVVEVVASTVAAAAQASVDIELVLLLVGLVIVVGLGLWWWRVTYVVRCDAAGYAVRNVRGAGVKRATWREVEDAATTHVHDVPVLVLTLKDGRTTTIPVSLLAVNREQFVRDLQQRLRDGEGIRPL